MNSIGQDCEDIIYDYVSQIEHVSKFKKCLNQINNIGYRITKRDRFCESHMTFFMNEKNSSIVEYTIYKDNSSMVINSYTSEEICEKTYQLTIVNQNVIKYCNNKYCVSETKLYDYENGSITDRI